MKKILFIVMLVIPVFFGYAFQWPVSDPVLVTSFGESKFGNFSKGIELQSGSDDVFPIDTGEVVFYRSGDSGGGMPSPLGNFAVVQHERGIYSIYAHLDKVYVPNYLFTAKDKIGTIGTTGLCEGKSLFLILLDGEFKQYINPLLSLPPLLDLKKPRIGHIYFVGENTGDNKKIEVKEGLVLKGGVYSIQVEIKDFNDNAGNYDPTAPFSISLYLNGENRKNIKFESLKLEDGNMVLQNSGDSTYPKLYASPWVYKIGTFDLSPGDTRIELAVKDFEGNESSQIIKITVLE